MGIQSKGVHQNIQEVWVVESEGTDDMFATQEPASPKLRMGHGFPARASPWHSIKQIDKKICWVFAQAAYSYFGANLR
jgi:hypothetical protein